MRLNLCVSLVASGIIFWPLVGRGSTPTTIAVGVYDETTTQQNNVDFNATGNSHTASTGNGLAYSTTGTFNSLVAAAFAAGHGGVAVFDDQPNGTSASALNVSYAGGTKIFQITFNAAYTVSTGLAPADSTAISDSNYIELGTNSVTLSLGSITGAAPGETGFTEIGLTLLSGNNPGVNPTPRNFGTVTVTAHFSDSSTASANRIISELNGAGDTFYSILAPAGLTITSFDISDTGGVAIPDIDDIAFVTVPEPAILILLLIAPVVLLGKRVLRAC